MKIADTSQDHRTVTGLAGKCRNFWLFDTDGRQLLELAPAQSLHDSAPGQPHPLDGVDVLISGGVGRGLVARLASREIRAAVTGESDPESAARAFLNGTAPADVPLSRTVCGGTSCSCA